MLNSVDIYCVFYANSREMHLSLITMNLCLCKLIDDSFYSHYCNKITTTKIINQVSEGSVRGNELDEIKSPKKRISYHNIVPKPFLKQSVVLSNTTSFESRQ